MSSFPLLPPPYPSFPLYGRFQDLRETLTELISKLLADKSIMVRLRPHLALRDCGCPYGGRT
jgi:hypothetical protein